MLVAQCVERSESCGVVVVIALQALLLLAATVGAQLCGAALSNASQFGALLRHVSHGA